MQPPSEVADSMPHNDISIDGFTTPTRIMNYFLQTAGPPSEPSQEACRLNTRDSTSVYAGNDELATLLAQGTDFILQGNVPMSTIPFVEEASSVQHDDNAHYETPENVGATSDARLDESHVSQTPSSPLRSRGVLAPPPPLLPTSSPGEPSAWASGLVRTSQQSQSELPGTTIPATQLPERAGSEPPFPKRLKSTCLHQEEKGHGLGRSTSDVLPRASRESAAQLQMPATDLAAPATQIIDWSHEMQLISAEPPPANHTLGPRVPMKLELLMRSFGIEGRYKPKFQARKMREYERGYWLLDLEGWDQKGKIETWGFLGNYIRKDGFAGWGTRACRAENWTWIRLYGWEHIAGELYILLYVASYRRLKAMEVTWYDGAGKALIVVGARSDKNILNKSEGAIGTGWR